MHKVLYRIAIVLLTLSVMFLSWCFSVILIFNRKKEVPIVVVNYKNYYQALSILEQELYEDELTLTKVEIKSYVEKDLGLKFYIYAEKDLGITYSGKAYPIIRTIIMDDDLINYQYCQTFAHEVLHLKLCLKNETYICYETFKYLYEDKVLHNVGVAYGWRQLTNPPASEYNIQAQVIYYLTNKLKFDKEKQNENI